MRIISGIYKGKKLEGFNILGTRPTMDRIKESLFAIIHSKLKNSVCLDLFSGSGSLGLEAISNGCEKCIFVDNSLEAISVLKRNLNSVKNAIIIKTDAFSVHLKTKEKFDIVFLDPPYQMNLITPALKYLREKDLLNNNCLIICEYETEQINTDNYEIIKEKKYGQKKILILEYRY